MPGELRTIALLRCLVAASIVGPLLVLAAVGWFSYQAILRDAEHEILRTSEVGREHASKVFDSFRLVAGQIQEILDGLDASAIRASERKLHERFVKLIHGLPQIESLIVVGRDGHPLVATAVYPVAAAEDFSDRDYFQALMKDEAPAYISRVQTSRITHARFFGWGVALHGPDGPQQALVDIAVSPDFFMRFYGTLIAEGGENVDGRIVSMVREDGEILVRFPRFEGDSARVSSPSPFFDAVKADPEAGAYRSRSVIDSGAPERLYAYRKVPGHPVYVVAGRSTASISAEWRRGMIGYLAVAVGAALALSLTSLAALRGAGREQRALARVRAEMSRRAEAEEQLRQAQKMEAVGQLTGGIAHDFNNLLTVIRSAIDFLRRPGLAEDRRSRYLEAISDTTTRATRLTSQLLAFARRQALRPEAFDVVANLGGVSEMTRTLLGSRIAVETDFPGEALWVHADPGQFDTAIVNLAVNARDAMNGEGRLFIAASRVEAIPADGLRPATRGDFVAVAIRDTGAGIPADRLARIFEPFFTTKEVGQGTGLGLSQVFGFAKQSGGEVTVASELGRGATFTLYLPRVEAGPPRPRRDPDAQSRAVGVDACVLVVEDNAEVCAMAAQALEELGCRSVLAANAEQALAELGRGAQRFDVVFSDVVMPGMNGVALGREIRRRYRDIPVVLTSGYSQTLSEQGADEFELLHKPYSVAQLSRALREAARWRRDRQHRRARPRGEDGDPPQPTIIET